VIELVFQILEKNELKTCFIQHTKTPGKEWLPDFPKRPLNLSLQQPYSKALLRASRFNNTVVDKHFDVSEYPVDGNKITAARMFIMDETSHTVVQRSEKIIAQKGRHQVEAITSCERGQNVAGDHLVSASSFYVPPMLIYCRN
jgi:hypothetical protein